MSDEQPHKSHYPHRHPHKRPKNEHDGTPLEGHDKVGDRGSGEQQKQEEEKQKGEGEGAEEGDVQPSALTNNPFMGMFNTFRDELDEHHDRRERVIKASRDITAMSKKMIFTMQRTRTLTPPLAPFITKDISLRQAQITELFNSLLPDIGTSTCTLNAYRYLRNYSGGIQEYLEAVSFHHYLLHGTLLTIPEAQASLPKGIVLTIADYLGGIFDLVGELMRIGITLIATRPLNPPGGSKEGGGVGQVGGVEMPKILNDLREFRLFFERIDVPRGGNGYGGVGKDMEKKMSVMVTCVEKVELAVYGMIVRGSERPAGWVPDTAGLATGEVGGLRGGYNDDDD